MVPHPRAASAGRVAARARVVASAGALADGRRHGCAAGAPPPAPPCGTRTPCCYGGSAPALPPSPSRAPRSPTAYNPRGCDHGVLASAVPPAGDQVLTVLHRGAAARAHCCARGRRRRVHRQRGRLGRRRRRTAWGEALGARKGVPRSRTFRSWRGPGGLLATSTPCWTQLLVDGSLVVLRRSNLGIAASTCRTGLIVGDPPPRRSRRACLRAPLTCAERGRGRPGLDVMAGGAFSITNDGPFGTSFIPIINQPQVAILATDIACYALVVTIDGRSSPSSDPASSAQLGPPGCRRAPLLFGPVSGPAGYRGLGRGAQGRTAWPCSRPLSRGPFAARPPLRLAVKAADGFLLVASAHVHAWAAADEAPRWSAGLRGADLVRTDRGGDVTYHGPGQLVVYPILTVPERPAVVRTRQRAPREQVVIDALGSGSGSLGHGRLTGYPGIWIDPDGPQTGQGRRDRRAHRTGAAGAPPEALHGVAALNVDWRASRCSPRKIVPCGIRRPPGDLAGRRQGIRSPARPPVADALVEQGGGPSGRRGGPEGRRRAVSAPAAPGPSR